MHPSSTELQATRDRRHGAFIRARAAWAGALLLALSGSALACGQMGPVDPTKPGERVTIRGYGYGYKGGERAVWLVWAATGATAGRASIDGNGEFMAEVVAPTTVGQYGLIVRQGEDDPAPAAVTVPVVAPNGQS